MKKNISQKPTTMIIIQFVLIVAIIIAIISSSLAWFSATQKEVDASGGTFNAGEQPIDTTGNAYLMAALGPYKGETGLGEYGTQDAPFFLELEITTAPMQIDWNLSLPNVKTVEFRMNEVLESGLSSPHISLKGVTAKRDDEIILDCTGDEANWKLDPFSTKDEILGGFCWRIALKYYPYSKYKEESRILIDTPKYYSPEDFILTLENSSEKDGDVIEAIYNKTDIVFVFSARLYFLSDEDMEKDPTERNPFIMSGYSKEKGDYIDYTFMDAAFTFDYEFSAPVYTVNSGL